ncbi:hypothetical protein [Nocardia sp. NPDC057668]|uniref:hypothetical protein n=1 Tax=Nocardia sp. NPDC057668 TaxID=3346202 RepID=UPI00366DA3ED
MSRRNARPVVDAPGSGASAQHDASVPVLLRGQRFRDGLGDLEDPFVQGALAERGESAGENGGDLHLGDVEGFADLDRVVVVDAAAAVSLGDVLTERQRDLVGSGQGAVEAQAAPRRVA